MKRWWKRMEHNPYTWSHICYLGLFICYNGPFVSHHLKITPLFCNFIHKNDLIGVVILCERQVLF